MIVSALYGYDSIFKCLLSNDGSDHSHFGNVIKDDRENRNCDLVWPGSLAKPGNDCFRQSFQQLTGRLQMGDLRGPKYGVYEP
jgi:hypothetical protein